MKPKYRIEGNDDTTRQVKAIQCPLLAEAVEKLFWGLPNERLIRDMALRGKNDSSRLRI
jgi:hypothetical protein